MQGTVPRSSQSISLQFTPLMNDEELRNVAGGITHTLSTELLEMTPIINTARKMAFESLLPRTKKKTWGNTSAAPIPGTCDHGHVITDQAVHCHWVANCRCTAVNEGALHRVRVWGTDSNSALLHTREAGGRLRSPGRARGPGRGRRAGRGHMPGRGRGSARTAGHAHRTGRGMVVHNLKVGPHRVLGKGAQEGTADSTQRGVPTGDPEGPAGRGILSKEAMLLPPEVRHAWRLLAWVPGSR